MTECYEAWDTVFFQKNLFDLDYRLNSLQITGRKLPAQSFVQFSREKEEEEENDKRKYGTLIMLLLSSICNSTLYFDAKQLSRITEHINLNILENKLYR